MAIVERNGNYYAVVWTNGKQKWIACGRDKRRAKTLHDECVVKARAGELPHMQAITFDAFAEKWLSDHCEPRLRKGTVRGYRSMVATHWTPVFGGMRLNRITAARVQATVAGMTRTGRLSPKTVRNIVGVLRKCLEVAVQWGYLQSNPAAHIALPRYEPREMLTITPEQLGAVIAATDERWRAAVALAGMCGLRRGEVLALPWSAVSWSTPTAPGSISITRQYYEGALQTPKSRAGVRRVPMPRRVEELLMERMLACPASDQDLVFCDDQGKPLGTNHLLDHVLRPAVAAVEGVNPRLRYHDLRHTALSILAAGVPAGTDGSPGIQGVDVVTLKGLAGHSTLASTTRYLHSMPAATLHAATVMDAAVGIGDDQDLARG